MSYEDTLRSRTRSPVLPHSADQMEEWVADRLQKFRARSFERKIILPADNHSINHHNLIRQKRLTNKSTIVIISEETELCPNIKVLIMTGFAEKSLLETSDLSIIYKSFGKTQSSEALNAEITG